MCVPQSGCNNCTLVFSHLLYDQNEVCCVCEICQRLFVVVYKLVILLSEAVCNWV